MTRNLKPGKLHAARSLCPVAAAACLAFGAGCTADDAQSFPYGAQVPEVKVHTRSSGSTAPGATLLFWSETNFHDKLVTADNAGVQPYGVAQMSRNIDYYHNDGGETFSTGLRYDIDDLHATGYAPSEALIPETGSDYTRLTVGDNYQDGQTDFLCCDGNNAHKGSAASPFTDKAHELRFRHLTSRIRFIGVRDEVMYDAISVNNVEVTLLQPDANNPVTKSAVPWVIPTAFELTGKKGVSATEDRCTYKVSASNTLSSITLPTYTNFIPKGEEGSTLSACYVWQEYPDGYDHFMEPAGSQGLITLALQIKADFSRYNGGAPVKYEDYDSGVRTVTIASNYGNSLLPGCEYVVTIRFKREGITLQGVQQAWEDGGTHYLPVEKSDSDSNSGEGE